MSGMPPKTKLSELAFCRWDASSLVGLAKGDMAAAYPGMALIKGIATTEHKDLDDEVVHTDGLTWSDPCFLTLEHPRTHDNIIGQVIDRQRIEMPDGTPGVAVVGGLYRHDPMAMRVYDRAMTIAKSGGSSPFGFSIEGPSEGLVREPGHLLKGRVTSLAVTLGPRNERAKWEPLMKGLLTGSALAFELVERFGLDANDLMKAAVLKRRNDQTWTGLDAAIRKANARTSRLGAKTK